MVPNQMGYPMMPPQFNWQQEMLNRLGSLQNQIQNSFPMPQQMPPQVQISALKGKIVGSKEEVLSIPADFDIQYFPMGNDIIYAKRLGMDGKSQILEYKLNPDCLQPEQPKQEIDISNIQKDFDILNEKYNALVVEFSNLKREFNKVNQQRKKEPINE